MAFDYFYGEQSQQFAFYRIPKMLFTDSRFRKISAEGKILYGLLLDRVSLSQENGWFDENGRVYIIYVISSICRAMNCTEKSAIKYLSEIENAGLVERRRQGQGKPAIIYVKNFTVPQELQVKTCNNSSTVPQKLQVKNCNNYSSEPVNLTGQELYFLRGNYTDNIKTDINYINPILSVDEDRMRYEKYFTEHFCLEALKNDYPYDCEMINEIMETVIDVMCTKKQTIRIAGDDKSSESVKSRFMKLGTGHVRYVIECMQENTTEIKNIKQYLITALYNAPATMNIYYRAKVNHDMAESCTAEEKKYSDAMSEWLKTMQ